MLCINVYVPYTFIHKQVIVSTESIWYSWTGVHGYRTDYVHCIRSWHTSNFVKLLQNIAFLLQKPLGSSLKYISNNTIECYDIKLHHHMVPQDKAHKSTLMTDKLSRCVFSRWWLRGNWWCDAPFCGPMNAKNRTTDGTRSRIYWQVFEFGGVFTVSDMFMGP